MEVDILKIDAMIPKLKSGKRFVIGIDGLSRSGKTTVVNKIKEQLLEEKVPVCIFHIDDYIVERKKRYNTGQAEWYEYYQLQWDTKWLKENFFEKLRLSNEFYMPTYDDYADKQKMWKVKIPETCLIIIEGVFLQRNEWKSFYDYIFYIDSPREERFKRENLSTQNNIDKFRNRYWKAEDYYLETEEPMKNSDFVFRN